MIKSTIQTVIKNGERAKKLREALKKYKSAYVSIGFHTDAGSYPDGTSVIEVALFNEFGTETTPARSFLRPAIDDNESLINAWREEMIENIISKDWPIPKALEAMGLRIQLLIQNKIKSNVPPPLADSTATEKARKGRPLVTLIDTGLMLRSVTYKVHLSRGAE